MFLLRLNAVQGAVRGAPSCARRMGGAPKPRRRLTAAHCAKMVGEMSPEEKRMLLGMLLGEEEGEEEEQRLRRRPLAAAEPPTARQLRRLALHQALPYVGFGFLDNFVMICAGEYIELTLGATLAIGTMTAAALGNTVSDVFGMGSAWYVERYAAMLAMSTPPLSIEQLEARSAKWASFAGRIGGLVLGCFLGMFPLLFNKGDESAVEEEEEEEGRK